MAATQTPKPRIYTNVDNMRRAIRLAGLKDIHYRIHAEVSDRRRVRPIFEPRNEAERERVLAARFSVE